MILILKKIYFKWHSVYATLSLANLIQFLEFDDCIV